MSPASVTRLAASLAVAACGAASADEARFFVPCAGAAEPDVCAALAAELAAAPGATVLLREASPGEAGTVVAFEAERLSSRSLLGRLSWRGAAAVKLQRGPEIALTVSDGHVNARLLARYAQALLRESAGPWADIE